jgi:solute carrier family 35 (UDP-galactose transporter), member B1
LAEELPEPIEQKTDDRKSTLRRNCFCILIALAIIVSFSTQAYFKRKLFKECFGTKVEGEKNCSADFKYAQSLTGVCLVVYWAVARREYSTIIFKIPSRSFCSFLVILLVRPATKEDETKVWYYVGCAVPYVLALVTGTKALEWISYPVKIVIKSAKPIPVIILGALIGGKSYAYRKYFFVLVIVAGVILFNYKDNENFEAFGWGEPLLFFSLMMDGVLGALEERLRSSTAPSTLQLMAALNGWGALLMIAPILITGEGVRFVEFAGHYPQIWTFIGALVAAGAIGQIFIFAMVTMFGSLACSVTTTIRKVFNLLFFVLLGDALLPQQWGGAALVFGALFGDLIFKKKPQPKTFGN